MCINMKLTMTLLIANKELNELMRLVDLKPSYKWYVTPHKVSFSTATSINDEYFYTLIKKSKEVESEFWIPGIVFCEKLYADKEVGKLSDGDKAFFVNGG